MSELSELLSFKGLVVGQWGWFKFEDVEAKFFAARERVLSGKANIIGVRQQQHGLLPL